MCKYFKYIFLAGFIISFLTGCNDDLLNEGDISGSLNGELPVTFDLSWPEEESTRAFDENKEVKTRFKEKDVIHILGTFNVSYLQEDGSTIEEVVTRYGALMFNGRLWQPVDNSMLTWPSNATDGQFTAYYIAESNGVLTKNDPTDTYLLSDITPTSDPLTATSAAGIGYGNAVPMNFYHMCAYLTLDNLEPVVSDNYWFTTTGVYETQGGNPMPFNNAFMISLTDIDNPNGPGLNFEFTSQMNSQYNKVFIEGDVEKILEDEEKGDLGQAITTKANFFLQPGFYESFNVIYPAGTNQTYDYLEYNYNNIPQDVGGPGVTNTPPQLEAGKTYTLTITKSPGITIVSPPAAGGWDETDNYYDVDVEEFLKAISEKKEYTYGTTPILETTPEGTRLLHNVDFHNFKYEDFLDAGFYPDIMGGSTFDGNLHYIRNLSSPLFRYNYGTIKNLGIKNADIEIISFVQGIEDNEYNRNGAFCKWNRANATISNIRAESVNINVYIKSTSSGETHNAGVLLGSNSGRIEGVSLSGNFAITVSGLSAGNPMGDGLDYPVMASVLIGGIAGQNAGEGTIYDVSPLTGTPSVRITNNCQGDLGSYSVGGIAGESQGYITGVIISDVVVNGTQSRGVTSYMGGIAGQLAVSTTTGATANANCFSNIVSGSIRTGVSNPSGIISSVSYCGGIAGTVYNVPVSDCRVSVSVYGPSSATENVTYGFGGAFGKIRPSEFYNITDIIAYANYLEYPSGAFAGNFTGIAPIGQTWENSYQDKGIIVRSFPGLQYIGGNAN